MPLSSVVFGWAMPLAEKHGNAKRCSFCLPWYILGEAVQFSIASTYLDKLSAISVEVLPSQNALKRAPQMSYVGCFLAGSAGAADAPTTQAHGLPTPVVGSAGRGASALRIDARRGSEHKEVRRKERRRRQGNLVRLLDAALPHNCRRGVCVNGAGDRALGMSGRSMHDVLEDAIEAVAAALPDADARRRKGLQTESLPVPRAGLGLNATWDHAAFSCGPLMRSFLDAHVLNEQAVAADARRFVSSPDASKRRKLAVDARDASHSSASEASTATSPTPLPDEVPRHRSAFSRPKAKASHSILDAPFTQSSLAPLTQKPQPLGQVDLPRLPPIRLLSGHVPHFPAIQHQQRSDIVEAASEAAVSRQLLLLLAVAKLQACQAPVSASACFLQRPYSALHGSGWQSACNLTS